MFVRISRFCRYADHDDHEHAGIPLYELSTCFARDVLQQGPVGLGYLGAAVGIGNFGGLYLVSRARRFASAGWIFIAGTILHCLALLTFQPVPFSPSLGRCWLVVGIGHACFGIMQSSIVLLPPQTKDGVRR